MLSAGATASVAELTVPDNGATTSAGGGVTAPTVSVSDVPVEAPAWVTGAT
jgi:hypothetical protein